MQPINLDTRIRDISDVQTILNYDDNYIRTGGFFANSIRELWNLDECYRGFLDEILEYCYRENDEIFVTYDKGNKLTFRYFIPMTSLDEIRYKPFDIDLFLTSGAINNGFVKFREKGNNSKVAELRYNGWSRDGNTCFVHLGGSRLTFEKLLDDYEYEDSSYEHHWLPFGVCDTNVINDSNDND